MGTDTNSEYGAFEIPSEIATDEGQLSPYPFYDKMREKNPVRYDEERGVWDIFRYDDVLDVASNHDIFSVEEGPTNTLDILNEAEGSPEAGKTMLSLDPPAHTEHRRTVDEFFRPDYLERYRNQFEKLADEILDDAITGDGKVDFASDIAWVFPVTIIAEMMDIPKSDREQFKEWSDRLVAAPSDRDPETLRKAHEDRIKVQQEMTEYFEDFVPERRQNPGDDLISAIIHSKDEGKEFTSKQIYNFSNLLLLAGNVTTTHLLTNAIFTFIEEGIIPDLENGEIPLDSTIEEVLRYRSSVHIIRRVTTQAVEMQGETIPKGATVVAQLASANRDPRQFDRPDTFIPTRKPNTHVAFGRGPHLCLGAPLARFEAEIMLSTFFDRVKDAEFATDSFEPFYGSTVYGLENLPIHVTLK
jgi:cytochrome P450